MSGVVEAAPRAVLRLEGLAALLTCVVVYNQLDAGWIFFLVFFFLPDLTFLAYLAGPRIGAVVYNVAHAYVGPAALLVLGALRGSPFLAIGLIWTAHIGLDRMLGYGLKYPDAFGHTHLGMIGRPVTPAS